MTVPPRATASRPVEARRIDRDTGSIPADLHNSKSFLAMVGRHVDEARAWSVGDEVAGEEWPRLGEKPAEASASDGGDGSGEVRAFALQGFLRLAQPRHLWLGSIVFRHDLQSPRARAWATSHFVPASFARSRRDTVVLIGDRCHTRTYEASTSTKHVFNLRPVAIACVTGIVHGVVATPPRARDQLWTGLSTISNATSIWVETMSSYSSRPRPARLLDRRPHHGLAPR